MFDVHTGFPYSVVDEELDDASRRGLAALVVAGGQHVGARVVLVERVDVRPERQLDRLPESRQRFADLLERASRYYGPGHRELVSILIGGAETALAAGHLDDALEGLAAAEANARQSLPPEHGYFSDIEGLRGMALLESGEFDDACGHLAAARASRSSEHQIKAQLKLETVALARCHCQASETETHAASVALDALQSIGNASPWQLALAQRWVAQCDGGGR